MAVTDVLRALEVKPALDGSVFDCELLEPPKLTRAEQYRAKKPDTDPLVSCLMVTRGNLDILPFSIDCYLRQTWARRELVVVTARDKVAAVGDYLRSVGIKNLSLTGVDPDLSLGDLRNVSVARARGDILIQWDDDDLYDPERIKIAVSTLLQAPVAAVFLARWVVWWPARNLAAISCRRVCEGSIALWRGAAPVYPGIGRAEDSWAIGNLNEPVALVDAPMHYVYVITGQNTWGAAHFQTHLAGSDYIFEDDEYREFCALLAQRVPLEAYAERLRRA